MRLYLVNGQPAGLYDVCEWLIKSYPEDIFTGESGGGAKLVADMRNLAKSIIKMRGQTFKAGD